MPSVSHDPHLDRLHLCSTCISGTPRPPAAAAAALAPPAAQLTPACSTMDGGQFLAYPLLSPAQQGTRPRHASTSSNLVQSRPYTSGLMPHPHVPRARPLAAAHTSPLLNGARQAQPRATPRTTSRRTPPWLAAGSPRPVLHLAALLDTHGRHRHVPRATPRATSRRTPPWLAAGSPRPVLHLAALLDTHGRHRHVPRATPRATSRRTPPWLAAGSPRPVLHLAALLDDARQARPVGLLVREHVLQLAHDEQPLVQHTTEHHVLVVKPLGLGACDEELRGLRVKRMVEGWAWRSARRWLERKRVEGQGWSRMWCRVRGERGAWEG